MNKIGITGGIGSGKSIIAKCFSSLGIPIYYADIEAKKIIRRNTNIKEYLIEICGEEIYFENGALNSKRFSEIIFNNNDLLEKSNQIIHPEVNKHFENWAKSFKYHDYIIKEAAIMFESGSNNNMNKIITVFSPKEMRIKRLIESRGLSLEFINKIMDNQMSEEEKIKKSDFVIYNNELELIIPQVLKIYKKLLKM